MKNSAKWGRPKSKSGNVNGINGINNGIVRDIVTKMFWIRRKDAKYNRPMVNWDFTSL